MLQQTQGKKKEHVTAYLNVTKHIAASQTKQKQHNSTMLQKQDNNTTKAKYETNTVEKK